MAEPHGFCSDRISVRWTNPESGARQVRQCLLAGLPIRNSTLGKTRADLQEQQMSRAKHKLWQADQNLHSLGEGMERYSPEPWSLLLLCSGPAPVYLPGYFSWGLICPKEVVGCVGPYRHQIIFCSLFQIFSRYYTPLLEGSWSPNTF